VGGLSYIEWVDEVRGGLGGEGVGVGGSVGGCGGGPRSSLLVFPFPQLSPPAGEQPQPTDPHPQPRPPPKVTYDVDPSRADQFYSLVRAYWPALPDGALAPAYAGVRPKVASVSTHPGAPAGDFVIQVGGRWGGRWGWRWGGEGGVEGVPGGVGRSAGAWGDVCMQPAWTPTTNLKCAPHRVPLPTPPRRQGKREHGVAGLAALYGMESPGLTSCLAIGAHVLRRLQEG
jgi:hypothetical protein